MSDSIEILYTNNKRYIQKHLFSWTTSTNRFGEDCVEYDYVEDGREINIKVPSEDIVAIKVKCNGNISLYPFKSCATLSAEINKKVKQ